MEFGYRRRPLITSPRAPVLGGRAWGVATACVLAVLVAASVYEAAVALGWISTGAVPGEGPKGGGAVLAAALLASLAGAGLSAALAARAHLLASPAVPLLPLAAAGFVLARFYTYDPYYAPTLRRMSEGGLIPGSWIALLVVSAVAASVLTRLVPRAGLLASAFVLLCSALIGLLEGAGH